MWSFLPITMRCFLLFLVRPETLTVLKLFGQEILFQPYGASPIHKKSQEQAFCIWLNATFLLFSVVFLRVFTTKKKKKNARIIRSLFTRTWRVQVYRRRQILITRNNNRTCLRDARSRRLHCTQIAVYDARGKREEVTPEQVRMLAPRSTAEASTLGAYFWLHTR